MDKDLNIWKTNRKAKEMLRQKHLDGKPLSVLGDLRLDLTDIQQNAGAWTHKECRIWKKQHPVDFIYSAQPVLSKEAELLGVLNAQHIALWSTWRKSGEEAMGTFQEMERKMISVTREQLNFNMAATVKKIGISRANLYRKVKNTSCNNALHGFAGVRQITDAKRANPLSVSILRLCYQCHI